MHLFDQFTYFFMAVGCQQQQCGGAQLMRHHQRGGSSLALNTAPETARKAAGRKQFVPVCQRGASAEKHCADQQVMLLHGKQGGLLCILVQHAGAKSFHSVQDRLRPSAGSAVILFRKKGKLVEGFRVHIAAVRIKKTM